MLILDTNVLSELLKPVPELSVIKWLESQPRSQVFTTATRSRTASRFCPRACIVRSFATQRWRSLMRNWGIKYYRRQPGGAQIWGHRRSSTRSPAAHQSAARDDCWHRPGASGMLGDAEH